jgi:methylated-DNA-[protein]-cysteine S-methyltransferase
MITTHTYNSPVGELIIGSIDDKLVLCDWKYRSKRASIDKRIQSYFDTGFSEGSSDIIEQTIKQLEEYFQGERTTFDIPMALAGSDFQQSVWNALLEIPFGESNSYLQLSTRLDNVKAIRAVASANGANAISIIIPCHRVIGSNGELTGYAGGLPAKKRLLELEGCMPNGQTSLF